MVRKVAAKPEAELEPMLSELQLGEFIYWVVAKQRRPALFECFGVQLGKLRNLISLSRVNRQWCLILSDRIVPSNPSV